MDGRLGPQPVVLDHTSGFEGLLFVDDDLLGVRHLLTSLQPFSWLVGQLIEPNYEMFNTVSPSQSKEIGHLPSETC